MDVVRAGFVSREYRRCLIGIASLLALPSLAEAQNLDSLRRALMVPLPTTTSVAATASRSSPGSSAGSPSAYGANYGDGFTGAGYQSRTRSTPTSPGQNDGSVVVGFGLGNSRDAMGVEIAITSLSTFRRTEGDRYSASFKLHWVLPKNIGLAFGMENALVYGMTDGGQSVYGVISSVLKLRENQGDPISSATISAGAGNGRFRSEQAIKAKRAGINGFGSIGIRLLSPISAIADWTGQDLTLAISVVPFARIPLILTPGFADVTGSAGDGARFTLGAGMGFKFSSIRDIFSR